MNALSDLSSRWKYTDREVELIEDLFARNGAASSQKVADFLLKTRSDIERPTFQQIARLFEQGVGNISSIVRSTAAPPPTGRELSHSEKRLFWRWLTAMFTPLPENRAKACRAYMDASSKAGHTFTPKFQQIVFGHYQRNAAKATA